MGDRVYTLKEMASALSPSERADDVNRLSRQIRHWTLMDLLRPMGGKYTGTGKSRNYTLRELYRAAILVEISRWRVPMTVLEESFDIAIEDENVWQMAIEGSGAVYLELSWNEDITVWKTSVGAPSLNVLKDPDTDPHKMDEPVPGVSFIPPASAIVINLTRLFRRVRVPL